ncbi:TadG family pilus assembly protein [Paraburkholderia phytofirmans]|uniref:TadG family pilus assembly protein n=1 Tax=Paraburkholderia phytofirmans TaxID=261302 RepID=UPI0038BD162F
MRELPSAMTRAARCARPLWMRRAGARRQHGSVAVVAVIWLSVAIAALGALDVGNVFFARRQLQRTADLAALAAVQMIGSTGGCATATTAAQQNAAANGFTAGSTTTINTTCGRWDTSKSTYFGTSGNPLNAVQVTTTQVVPYFFLGPSRNVSATATAFASNIDAFSLGTGIASINTQQSALLNAILGGLLNANLSLSVGDTQSLASAHIKLDDLRVALGAATMKQLLGTSVSVHDLMVAMATALTAGGNTVSAGILNTLALAVPGGQNIALGNGVSSAPGLLALGLANPESAASASINALDALLVAAQIAQSPHVNPDGSTTQPPAINVAAALPGVAALSLQVVNPPVLAVGEGGTDGSGLPRTGAQAASIKLNVTLPPLLAQPLNLGIATISALSTPIVLTLAIAPAAATLSTIDCESSKAATRATMQVTPGIAALCLGADSNCSQTTKPARMKVASISLVLLGQVADVQLAGLKAQATPGPTSLVFDGSSGSFDVTKSTNSNAVGSDLSSLTTGLLASLGAPNAVSIKLLGTADLGALLQPILSAVGIALTGLLQPVFDLLNTLIVPTLSLLGVQVGTATVHNMSLTCGVSQLVN